MRRLCATVLIFEAIVIGLAIPVAIRIGHVSAGARPGQPEARWPERPC